MGQSHDILADFRPQPQRQSRGFGKTDRIVGDEQAGNRLRADLGVIDENADLAVAGEFRRSAVEALAFEGNSADPPSDFA